MGLDFSIAPIRPGLDPSYAYGFSYAATHHARWGTDFLSTYGPFGCVITTMDLGGLVWIRLVASLVLAAGFGVATAVYLRGLPGASAGRRLTAMVAVVYASSVQGPEYHWFTFFLLVLLIGILADGPAGLAAYAVAGLLVGFFLLVKYRKIYSSNRIFISWVYNTLLRFMFRTRFRDVSTGLRMVRRSLVDEIRLESNSPFIGAELAIKAMVAGYRVGEAGIQTFPRTFGQGSSTSRHNIIATIVDMWRTYRKMFSDEYDLPPNRERRR